MKTYSGSRLKCKRDIRFGTWNVWSLYRAASLAAVVRELGRYKFDLVGVQEFGREKVRAGDYSFYTETKFINSIGNRIFCTPQNSVSS